jgi:general stress protein 26
MHPLNLSESEIRQRTWVELERAAQDRHHEWRTPVMATVTKDGLPNARVVVLRHADARLQRLQFFTDRRSAKLSEVAQKSTVTMVFWSKRLNWQLRVRAGVEVLTDGPEVDTVWKSLSRSAAAGDYLSVDAPGDELGAGPVEPCEPSGIHHLAIMVAHVQEIDWLELRRSGHRRATFGQDAWQWRVP